MEQSVEGPSTTPKKKRYCMGLMGEGGGKSCLRRAKNLIRISTAKITASHWKKSTGPKEGVIFHHDNARPNTSLVTQQSEVQF